jgi:glycosyltransferase involved in cell wall biosynthesis
MRILQVVGNMNRAGAETWLMHVLRHIDPRQFQFDFLVHSEREYAYSEEIRSRGGRLLACQWPAAPSTYARRFGRILDREGPYDVVHSHLNYVGGWVLSIARTHRVPRRILHSHTAPAPGQVPLRWRALGAIGRRWMSEATERLAVSETAARATFGHEWERQPDTRVLHCGVDLSPFIDPIDRTAYRRRLGLDDDTFVIGHVGRFVTVKNHRFIVRVAAAVARLAPDVKFLLIGDGPRRREIHALIDRHGLRAQVLFAGSQPDVPHLLRACVDVFLLPSHSEALCLAVVEAQAAGLVSVISDAVPGEAIVCPALVQRLARSASPETWAAALLAQRNARQRDERRMRGVEAVAQSVFDIRKSVAALSRIYAGGEPVASGAA